MCEGGREVSRGGEGARLLVELGCDHDDHDNHDDPVRGSLKESLAIEKSYRFRSRKSAFYSALFCTFWRKNTFFWYFF